MVAVLCFTLAQNLAGYIRREPVLPSLQLGELMQ